MHRLYADDVVLFGVAKGPEAEHLATIMKWFGRLACLCINNEKSTVWFSRRTDQRKKLAVRRAMPVDDPNDNPVYIGHPMPAWKVGCKHYTTLIEKLFRKFRGEKWQDFHM
jgi:hypothetical protein